MHGHAALTHTVSRFQQRQRGLASFYGPPAPSRPRFPFLQKLLNTLMRKTDQVASIAHTQSKFLEHSNGFGDGFLSLCLLSLGPLASFDCRKNLLPHLSR